MADRKNLIRKTITDKNGVQTTRWVKPDALAGSSVRNLPAPKATSVEETAAVLVSVNRIVDEQNKLLKTAVTGQRALFASFRVRSIQIAKRAENFDRLRIYAETFDVDDIDPRTVDRCIRVIGQTRTTKNIAGALTEEHVRAAQSFIDIKKNTYDSRAEEERETLLVDGCILLAVQDIDDAPQIAELLKRGYRAAWQIEEMLAGSKETHSAVVDGIL